MKSQVQFQRNPISLFDIYDKENLAIINEQKLQSKCPVDLKKEGSHSLTDRTTYPIMLELRGDYVVASCPLRKQIISAFLCDYDHQFEIMRKPACQEGKLGEPISIKFMLKNYQKPIEFHIKNEAKEEIQFFAKKLGQKFIVQLGFHNLFKAIRKIGKGMTACVYNATCYASNKQVAIKSFRRSVYFASQNNNGQISFKKQFKFLTLLNHKNICRFNGVYETENSTYVIMELLPLSLYGYLQKFGFPNQIKAKTIMKGLLEGIQYLHKKKIMHRDLKLQNIMVKKDVNNPGQIIPVIVDLGLAEYCDNPQYLYVRCGTPGYVAPQILKIKSSDQVKSYNSKCDIFSLAVVFYILLFQKALFEGSDVQEVVKKNSQCQLDFQKGNFVLLSQEARDLFKKMLQKDPLKRISATQALQHPYFTGQGQINPQIQKNDVCGSTMQDVIQTVQNNQKQ